MEIKNNVLKGCLRNVYFVSGTPCGGKTTISRALSQKHGFTIYDADAEFVRHKNLSNPISQPAMNQTFLDADAFFSRPYQEYGTWLLDSTREQLDFILMDLIQISKKQPVLCDLHLTPKEADSITVPERIVFLIRDPHNLIDEYCGRPDHADFYQFMNSASDPVYSKGNCSKALEYVHIETYEAIKRSPYFWLERTESSTVEHTVHLVEEHFGFNISE